MYLERVKILNRYTHVTFLLTFLFNYFSFRYKEESTPLVLIVGKEYGSGSSRDWAAKGPFLLGIKVVIAESFERIHRSNLVGMGIIPLQFLAGQNAESLSLTGREIYNISIPEEGLKPGQTIQVEVMFFIQYFLFQHYLRFFFVQADGNVFDTILRFDTEVDITYFRNGGILNYMIRKMLD